MSQGAARPWGHQGSVDGGEEGGGGSGGGAAISGDWLQNLVMFARTNVNAAINSPVLHTDCEKSTLALCGLETLGGGGSGAKYGQGQSGVIRLLCDAAPNSSINLVDLQSGSPTNSTLIDNPRLRSFFLASHLRLTEVPVDTSVIRLMSLLGQTTFDKYIGIRPSVSGTNLIFGLDSVQMEVSSVAIPSVEAYHWCGLGWDVVTSRVTGWFDSQLVGSFVIDPADMDDVPQNYRNQVFCGATGGVQGVDIDKLAVLTVEPS